MGALINLELLYLKNNQLRGEIPPELGNMKFLRRLHLEGNQLTGSIPSEFNNLRSFHLDLENNNLTELPDLSKLKLTNLDVRNNNLTFEDIEPNIEPLLYRDYFPQKKIDSIQNYQVTSGDSITLSVNVGGEHNTYQWYKNNFPIEGATNDTLVVKDFDSDDEGVYVCKINNTEVTKFTNSGESGHPFRMMADSFFENRMDTFLKKISL
jgi:Leucine-rich repeat (LRR) protein